MKPSPNITGKRLQKLLRLEKKRRGLREDELLFTGMANVAKYYWCAMQSVLQSQQEELSFFNAYLTDRLAYSSSLGLIESWPKRDKEILEVGERIGMPDVERILKDKTKELETKRTNGIDSLTPYFLQRDIGGNIVWVLHPALPSDQHTEYQNIAKADGIRIAPLEEFPKLRGVLSQAAMAEKYPTIRWNFNWSKYVLVGVPDGITDEFVYEYKSSRDKYLMNLAIPIAFTQADLYGHFFQRTQKKVQIHCIENDTVETWEKDIDHKRVESVLTQFAAVDGGWKPAPPKEKWKCNKCEFNALCPIRW